MYPSLWPLKQTNNLLTEFIECPNCNAKIKGGLLSSNAILSKPKTDVIKKQV